MPASWTQRTDPYAPAIIAAQALLQSPVDKTIFQPVADYLRRDPLPADRTYGKFFDQYFPEAIHSIASQHQMDMQARRLKKFGKPSALSAPKGLIVSPEEIEEATRALGLLTTKMEGESNYYATTQTIEEWVRALYPNLRHLSEGDTSASVRQALSTTGVMLDLAEEMVEREEQRLSATIKSERTELPKIFMLKADLERTEQLERSIEAIQNAMKPVYRPFIQERGVG